MAPIVDRAEKGLLVIPSSFGLGSRGGCAEAVKSLPRRWETTLRNQKRIVEFSR